MANYYEKSRPVCETVSRVGRWLFAVLGVLSFLLTVLLVVGQCLQPGQDTGFVLAGIGGPLFGFSALCFAAYKAGRSGSPAFYLRASIALAFLFAGIAGLIWLFEGFTPG